MGKGKFIDVPPILSMTAPRTRPEQVSNTKTLLPAWMFASVNIWASVSCRKWLHKTHYRHYTPQDSLPAPENSPNLPRFSAMVHHRQDTTGWFKNCHSVFISWKKQDENTLKHEIQFRFHKKLKIVLEITHFFFFFLMYLSWAYSVLSLNVELLSISCWMISCESHSLTFKCFGLTETNAKKISSLLHVNIEHGHQI